ncbi:TPA: GTPase ObgE [bacterium]|nr:GTPase ObgE [bacterium]
MFVDKIKVKIKAGDGGNGAISFRREKYVDKGGPSGGDGGDGGSIYFVGKSGLTTLVDFRYNRTIKAANGENGQKSNCFGKKGEDVYINVPIGTVVKNIDTNRIVADITKDGETVLIAKGGKGGKGNAKFANSRNQVPRIAENGDAGENYNALIELKLLADVGMVGFPSVGKSTLLSVLTNAKPEIADYHFTTLKPNLGIVSIDGEFDFVLADLPGLIKGAHEGKGLGISFLKHIERCRVILHVIDMSSRDQRDPYEDYLTINEELRSYNVDLEKRPMIIAANKMDEDVSQLFLEEFRKKVSDVEIFPISALTREGLEPLVKKLYELVQTTPEFPLEFNEENFREYTLEDKQDTSEFFVKKDNDVWVIYGENITRIFNKINMSSDAGVLRFLKVMRGLGIEDELRKQGIKEGETVRIEDLEFVYYE